MRALIGMGVTAEWQGDLARAAAHYEAAHTRVQAIEMAELGRMAHWRALPLANLGDLAVLQGNPVQATRMAEEALALWREQGYLWGIAQALGTQAAAASLRGEPARAAGLFGDALAQWMACSDLRGIAGTLAGIAGVSAERGDLAEAARMLGAAWGLADAVGVQFLAHHLYAERVLAAVRTKLGDGAFLPEWETGRRWSMDEAIAAAGAIVAAQDHNGKRQEPQMAMAEPQGCRCLQGGGGRIPGQPQMRGRFPRRMLRRNRRTHKSIICSTARFQPPAGFQIRRRRSNPFCSTARRRAHLVVDVELGALYEFRHRRDPFPIQRPANFRLRARRQAWTRDYNQFHSQINDLFIYNAFVLRNLSFVRRQPLQPSCCPGKTPPTESHHRCPQTRCNQNPPMPKHSPPASPPPAHSRPHDRHIIVINHPIQIRIPRPRISDQHRTVPSTASPRKVE